MSIPSFSEYVEYYKKTGRCMGEGFSTRKKPWNEAQLRTRYSSFLRKEERKKEQQVFKEQRDPRELEVLAEVWERDNGICRLRKALYREHEFGALRELEKNAGGLKNQLDGAHVFGKGSFDHMRFDLDNVVLLNRYSHSLLDQQKHPVNGKALTKEQKESWWKFIVGDSVYEDLKQRSLHGSRTKEET